jgi:DNA-binding NtrC family response regulator
LNHAQRILVVDDDAAMREMLASLFASNGYEVETADSAESALEKNREAEFDAILSDVRMPGKSGTELVGELRELRPQTPVVLMTAFGSIDSAVEAMRVGALDYITKPFEPAAVQLTLERALERRVLEEENKRLRKAVDRTSALGDLIGDSPAMREVFALIRKVAHGRSNVLITGESGTGKEVVARTLHFHGARAERPWVPINCTAIPAELLESELFGHVRGAFTGAHASKRGLFEQAEGGTLFLDEVGDMDFALQGKLLRALQEREIRPVGGDRAIPVDVRIVAATNRDLQEEIRESRFREDLFYRLNVIPIHLPPLRERRGDIAPLVEFFLAKHGGGETRSVTPAALRELELRDWKGNARELENTIERALALSDASELEVADLPPGPEGSPDAEIPAGSSLARMAREELALKDLEDRYIDAVLEHTQGNRVKAARILGIDRKTLYRRQRQRDEEAGD